ncbi:DUF4350 domain-containing protein [Novosphingobium flavum]|uniref:DUF4350 domain-containing protein n=1 Tax=Novosphingobium flavum TaxID=1778672 RepID=A0A7X1FNY9_9SPHN|nr:N,N-dimethylformamidase beta subunit family domain-containing protein [Novosphingobium flavum]MBC2664295.1 DUF4350 domain-containing protein [Novosphingobium flavum]
MIAAYTSVLSARPGDPVDIHLSSSGEVCRLEIARLGRERGVVLEVKNIATVEHAVPADADTMGCGWPVTATFTVGAGWESGYYELRFENELGETTCHFVCVLPSARTQRALLVLATNTYQAYNWWGGRSTYGDIGAVMDGRLGLFEALDQAVGIVSQERPFAQGILNAPEGVPKLMNGGLRGAGELPDMPSRRFTAEHGLGPLDNPAGFKNKWEHKFVAWCEEHGIGLDYATDRDLNDRPHVLDGYACVLVVGHSEYWSGPQRQALDDYVDQGGNLAVFSGNTSYWKVRWDGSRMVCHKSRGIDREPDLASAATGLWSHPQFARPEAALLGLTFLLGGYHRLGMCVARGTGSYTVYDETHWALEGCDLFYGDQIGGDSPLLAYENDGCLLQFNTDGRLSAVPHLGVPADLAVIAMAPAVFAEEPGTAYPPILAPEKLELAALVAHGHSEAGAQDRLRRGHAVMASFRREKGEVFNAGTTEWASALASGLSFVPRITLNVLQRFGAVG